MKPPRSGGTPRLYTCVLEVAPAGSSASAYPRETASLSEPGGCAATALPTDGSFGSWPAGRAGAASPSVMRRARPRSSKADRAPWASRCFTKTKTYWLTSSRAFNAMAAAVAAAMAAATRIIGAIRKFGVKACPTPRRLGVPAQGRANALERIIPPARSASQQRCPRDAVPQRTATGFNLYYPRELGRADPSRAVRRALAQPRPPPHSRTSSHRERARAARLGGGSPREFVAHGVSEDEVAPLLRDQRAVRPKHRQLRDPGHLSSAPSVRVSEGA